MTTFDYHNDKNLVLNEKKKPERNMNYNEI